MPWTCCGAAHGDDEPSCPTCGKEKQKWTLRFDRTRVFSFSGKPKLDDEWDLETLDHTPDSFDEGVESEEEEDWELETLDALPADEDERVSTGGGPALSKSRKDTEAAEDDDWDLESLDAMPADEDERVAAGSGGPLGAVSTREKEGAAPPAEDEDWELELLEQATTE